MSRKININFTQTAFKELLYGHNKENSTNSSHQLSRNVSIIILQNLYFPSLNTSICCSNAVHLFVRSFNIIFLKCVVLIVN